MTWTGKLKQIDQVRWEIPRDYKAGMRVPARIYADAELLGEMKRDLTLRSLTAGGKRRTHTAPNLAGEMRDLADRLRQAADRLDEDGHVNGLGVVQHRGSEIDRLCGVYRTLVTSAERMQKAAGIDPNA